MIKVYGIWSEWDLGHEGVLFKTPEKAKEYAKECFDLQGMEEDFEEIWGDLMGTEGYDLHE